MNHVLGSLPVLVISAHSRCNCRCSMCDIWKTTESVRYTEEELRRQLPDMQALGVRWVVFTGGEPLLNPELFSMAALLKQIGIRVTVLSSGLLLGRFARQITDCVDEVIVSLDGPAAVHDRIRGVIGAFAQLSAGVQMLRRLHPTFPVSARCTVQKANHDAVVAAAQTAAALELTSISFLAVDVSTAAFNHEANAHARLSPRLMLNDDEISELQQGFRALSEGPLSSMVAESPAKLARIVEYFQCMVSGRDPKAPLCNAPWVSAVLDNDGSVRPCFFQPAYGNAARDSLAQVVNGDAAVSFRRELDIESNPICRRCVCSLYRAEVR